MWIPEGGGCLLAELHQKMYHATATGTDRVHGPRGSQKLIKEYCTRGSGLRQSYLKHASCLNTASRGQKECIKDLQSAFEVITTVEWDKRIKVGCCAYNQVLECSEKIIENKCGKDATEFMRLLMRMGAVPTSGHRLQGVLDRIQDLQVTFAAARNGTERNKIELRSFSTLLRLHWPLNCQG